MRSLLLWTLATLLLALMMDSAEAQNLTPGGTGSKSGSIVDEVVARNEAAYGSDLNISGMRPYMLRLLTDCRPQLEAFVAAAERGDRSLSNNTIPVDRSWSMRGAANSTIEITFMLHRARENRAQYEAAVRNNQPTELGYVWSGNNSPSHDDAGRRFRRCQANVAMQLVNANLAGSIAAAPVRSASPPVPAANLPRPPAAAPTAYPPGNAPRPAPRRIAGVVNSSGVESDLGPKGMAAAKQALLPQPGPVLNPEQVLAQRRASQSASERAAFQRMKSRVVHNRANDATACLKVEPTGVISEWGIEGRFRLINSCGYPVEASWCANNTECSTGRGSTWTIRGGGNYPIFFADADNPNIAVGGCKAGEAKQPPLGEQPGINRTGFSEARDMPQAAAGVTLMTNHRCE